MATSPQVSDWQDYAPAQSAESWQDYKPAAPKLAPQAKPGILERTDTAIQDYLAPSPENMTGSRAKVLSALGVLAPMADPETRKTLGREVYSGGKTIIGMVPGIYHAIVDPATEDEKTKYAGLEKTNNKAPGTETSGAKRIGLVMSRLLGVNAAEDAAHAYFDPKTRPTFDQAMSVLPEALGQGAGTVVGAKGAEIIAPRALNAAQPVIAPAVRTAGKIIEAASTPEIAGRAVGGTTGAFVGRATTIPHAGILGAGIGEEIGGAIGRNIGSEPLLPTPGMQVYGYGRPAPGLRAIPEGPDFLRGRETLFGDNVITKPETSGVQIDTSPKNVGRLTRQMTNSPGTQIVPGVSMKNQPNLPEGFTPHESSWVKATKYDPDAREFEYITKDGQHYVRGDVGQAAADAFNQRLDDTGSAGKAMDALKKHPEGGVGQFQVMEGERVPVQKAQNLRSATPESEPPETPLQRTTKAAEKKPVSSEEDLTDILTESLRRARARRK
jgi:hypothetical protein